MFAKTKAGESTVQSYNFPLFIIGGGGGHAENLFPDFRAFLDARYDLHYTPEEILGLYLRRASCARLPSPLCRISAYRLSARSLSRKEGAIRPAFRTRLDAGAGASAARPAAQQARRLSGQGRSHGRGRALFARGNGNIYQQDPMLQTRAAGGVGVPHRRLSGDQQISEIAQGPDIIAGRDRSCVRHRRQPRLHHRTDGRN